MGADCDEVLLGQDELQCAWTNRNSGRRTAGDGSRAARRARDERTARALGGDLRED